MAGAEDRSAATGPKAVLRLVGSRNYGPWFVGNAVSASGSWFQNLAASLFVYRETHSAFLLGVLNFSQFAAILLLFPVTGMVADRFDRKRAIIVTQSFALTVAAVLALLTATGNASVTTVILTSLCLGVASAFSAPLQQALVTGLVEPRDLLTAVSLNSMTFNLARTIGPVLGAITVSTLGIAAAFGINALSYLTLIVGVLLVHPRPNAHSRRAPLRESLHLVRANRQLLTLLLVVAAVGFAADPINTLAPIFAGDFGYPDVVGGVIIGVYGLGAVTAAFVLAGRTPTRERLAVTLGLMAGGTIVFCLLPWFAAGLAALAVGGFGYLASNTSVTTRLQLEVEDHQRGRIMALWSVAFLGLRPAASLLDGAIASVAGVSVAGIVLQVPALVGLAVLVRGSRRTS